MKIWELDWTEGKKYKALYENNSYIIYVVKNKNLVDLNGFTIHAEYKTSELTNVDFEPVANWSQIKVDTKLLVSADDIVWYKRHFAKYIDNTVYAFNNGRTSWSETNVSSWKYVKLEEV